MKRLILCLIALNGITPINANLAQSMIQTEAKAQVSQELFAAVESGSLSQVKKALKKPGLDINALNNKKETVLDIATKKELTKIAGRLLKFGAKVTSEDNAYKLISLLNSRAHKFFWAGFLLSPWLWIASFSAWSNTSQIRVLVL